MFGGCIISDYGLYLLSALRVCKTPPICPFVLGVGV